MNYSGKLAVLDIKIIAAKWYMGELSGEDMPAIACEALKQEHDGVNLRYLAGLSRPTRRAILEIEDRALQELGAQAPITRHDAASRLARLVANEIIRGRIEPYGRACRICRSCASDAPELEHWSNLSLPSKWTLKTGKLKKPNHKLCKQQRTCSPPQSRPMKSTIQKELDVRARSGGLAA